MLTAVSSSKHWSQGSFVPENRYPLLLYTPIKQGSSSVRCYSTARKGPAAAAVPVRAYPSPFNFFLWSSTSRWASEDSSMLCSPLVWAHCSSQLLPALQAEAGLRHLAAVCINRMNSLQTSRVSLGFIQWCRSQQSQLSHTQSASHRAIGLWGWSSCHCCSTLWCHAPDPAWVTPTFPPCTQLFLAAMSLSQSPCLLAVLRAADSSVCG